MGPFQASGKSQILNVTGSSARTLLSKLVGYAFRVVNPQANGTLYLSFGDDTVTVSTTDFHYHIPAGVIETINIPEGLETATHIAVISPDGGGTITLSRGKGV